MFSTKKDTKTNSFILTPKWNKDTDRVINFEAVKVIDTESHVFAIFDNATAKECKEWVQGDNSGSMGKYEDVDVRDSVIQLKLLKKEVQMYGKTFEPGIWDKFIIEKLNELKLDDKPELFYRGFIDCNNNNSKLVELYNQEDNPEKRSLYIERIINFELREDSETSPEFNNIKSSDINVPGSNNQQKKSFPERWDEKQDYIIKHLSIYFFEDETHTREDVIARINGLNFDEKGSFNIYWEIIKASVS